jgi:hypothetical protein
MDLFRAGWGIENPNTPLLCLVVDDGVLLTVYLTKEVGQAGAGSYFFKEPPVGA